MRYVTNSIGLKFIQEDQQHAKLLANRSEHRHTPSVAYGGLSGLCMNLNGNPGPVSRECGWRLEEPQVRLFRAW